MNNKEFAVQTSFFEGGKVLYFLKNLIRYVSYGY